MIILIGYTESIKKLLLLKSKLLLAIKPWYPQTSSVRTILIQEMKQIYFIMKALEKEKINISLDKS